MELPRSRCRFRSQLGENESGSEAEAYKEKEGTTEMEYDEIPEGKR
jgi:hypothetical protein